MCSVLLSHELYTTYINELFSNMDSLTFSAKSSCSSEHNQENTKMKCEAFFRIMTFCGPRKRIKVFQCVACCRHLHRDDADNNIRTVCLFVVYLATLSVAMTIGIESNFKIIHKW